MANYINPTSVKHPHESNEVLPERLTIDQLKGLMEINQPLVISTIFGEWMSIVGLIYLSNTYWYPWLYLVTVILIGARQHALLVIGHDASHYVLLKNKKLNDWIADLFLFWPMFATVKGFRFFHSDHHRFLNTEKDKNRLLWKTHTPEGQLTSEWTYPKPLLEIFLRILSKMCFLTGLRWMTMGLLGIFINMKTKMIPVSPWYVVLRLSFYCFSLAIFWYFNLFNQFLLYWIVPFCTWHVTAQYIRLICEHSAIQSTVKPYDMTRTTIANFLDSLLIIPHNIGYHHEHHWYPSVPYYHLPQLNQLLATNSQFSQYGNVTHSVYESLQECTKKSS